MAKPQKKHVKSLIVLLSAAALAVIGSIMAYFTTTDQTTNKFVGSRFDIFLSETKWDAAKAYNVLPGDELDKNPQITNKERTDGYVFMRVTVPCDTQMIDNDDGTTRGVVGGNIPMYKFMVAQGTDPETYAVNTDLTPAQAVNPHWRLVTEPEYLSDKQQYVYVYAYADSNGLVALHQNQITEPLFDKLQLWNFSERAFEPDNDHGVRVEGMGIQTDLPGYTAENIAGIWALLEQEVGS